jgi:23S rRNA (uracil1939-C5)-methyltransferase
MEKALIHIEKMVYGGKGLSRDLKLVTFVPFTLPGEEVQVQIVKRKKDYQEAEALEIVTAAPERVAPSCRYFGHCGGCQMSHAKYETQVQLKLEMLKETLKRNRIDYPEPQVVTGPPFGYRHRARLKFHTRKRQLGFYQAASHEIVDIAECLCLTPGLNMLLKQLRNRLVTHPIPSLNQIEIYENDRGETAAYFDAELPQEIAAELSLTTRVFGPKELDQLALTLQFRHYEYPMHPEIFIQINPKIWKTMVQEVESHYPADRAEVGLELYCGTGFFTLPLSEHLQKIHACEENRTALEYAKKHHHPDNQNINWICSRAEELKFPSDATVAILDPPRSGLHKKVTEQLLTRPFKKITYISCDPASFARDLGLLKSHYRVEQLTMLDLFPQTYHIETIALLRSIAR